MGDDMKTRIGGRMNKRMNEMWRVPLPSRTRGNKPAAEDIFPNLYLPQPTGPCLLQGVVSWLDCSQLI